MDLTIACVWVGERYGAEYPAILQDMVRRHLSAAHTPRFVCITDRPSELPDGMEAIEPEPGMPGWWQKVALFKPGKLPAGRILYLDLDVAVTGNLDDLAARPGIIRDWHLPTYNSSVMVWNAGEHAVVWTQFDPSIMVSSWRSDQEWIEHLERWEEFPSDWCVSYRTHASVWPPAEAKVVCFHGEPKPHEITDGWVPLVWQQGGLRAIPSGTVNVSHERLYANMRSAVSLGLPVFTGQPQHGRSCCIVGSGPSVRRYLDEIRLRQDEGAAVVSLNGSLRWLLEHSITPSSHVLLDARPENVEFARDVPHETTVLVASQCDPAVFDALAGHPGVILWHADLNGDDKQLDIVAPNDGDRVLLVGGGGTVGLRAMYLAYLSGFQQLHLYGFDSCYTVDGEHHAFPQPLNNGERVFEVMMAGHSYLCSGWMANQAQQFNAHYRTLGGQVSIVAHGPGLIPDICRILNEEKHD